jgi:phosphohistidine phosphatase
MPRLLLLRHAKSSWKHRDLDDFDRPLARRGRNDAALVATRIAAVGLKPQKILCSSARRCRETLAALLPSLEGDVDLRLLRDLYLADEDHTIDQIRAHGGGAATLMVIGHNPGLEETALALAGTGRPELIEALADRYPTGTLAVIDFPAIKWVDIEPKTGRLVAFLRPNALDEVEEPEDEEAE